MADIPHHASEPERGLNCWEFKNCGREPGGAKADELGVCPAATDLSTDGTNRGRFGGRLCWAVTGTLCGGQVQGSFAQKELRCLSCDFFVAVRQEESQNFRLLRDSQNIEEVFRQIELRYRRMYDGLPIGFYRSLPAGQFVDANPAFLRMVGFPDRDALRNANAKDLYAVQEDRDRWKQAMEKEGGVFGLEVQLRRRDGAAIWVRENARAEKDASGRALYYEGTVEDVTERRRLEQQFIQAQKMESVGRLAGGIAHDFNNLLLVINGYSELLLSKLPPDDPNRASIEQILEAGRRAAGLTRQILAFSRRQPVEAVRIDLNELLGSTQKILQRLIGENIRLEIRAARTPVFVKADPGQLEQVVMNLAVNARDAMPEGGTLSLGICTQEFEGAPHALLCVADTGCGMDAKTLAHLFEPFFTTKPQGKGTGLGLSTVYGIVHQSNGQIRVTSEVGKGTTFRIYLPLLENAPAHAPVAPTAAPVPRGNEIILVVEDEAPVRWLIVQVLRSSGYSVRETGDPWEALRILEGSDPIHLLLTDSVMPGLSGPELVRSAAPLRPALPVLCMSGYSDRPLGDGPASGQAFLQKPFSPDALRDKVRALLDAPRS